MSERESQVAQDRMFPKTDSAKRPLFERRWFWGICAGTVWFLIFSAGILVDSLPHRVALGWKSEETRDEAAVGRLAKQMVQSLQTLPVSNQGPSSPNDQAAAQNSATSAFAVLAKAIQDQASQANVQTAPRVVTNIGFGQTIYHFLAGMILFTPINVALLALLAGLIGGCASNEADHDDLRREIIEAEKHDNVAALRLLRRKLHYLKEHPAYSMMRSFIVYLVFVSGIYIATSDPFNPSSQAQGFTQYIRLAGLVSLLGFMVGYDPTRFEQWLDIIPSPANQKKATDVSDGNVTLSSQVVKTTQVSVPAESLPARVEET